MARATQVCQGLPFLRKNGDATANDSTKTADYSQIYSYSYALIPENPKEILNMQRILRSPRQPVLASGQ